MNPISNMPIEDINVHLHIVLLTQLILQIPISSSVIPVVSFEQVK